MEFQKLLAEKKITQAKLSKHLGVHVNTIYNWMHNKNYPLNQLVRTASLLQTDIATLSASLLGGKQLEIFTELK